MAPQRRISRGGGGGGRGGGRRRISQVERSIRKTRRQGPTTGRVVSVTQNPPGEVDDTSLDFLTGEERNAYEALRLLFESYGLGSLTPKILEFVQEGFDESTIALMLQETEEYKARFRGNEIRKKKGIGVLNPAQYIQLEDTYRQLLSQAGLPEGFYDDDDDFANWIGEDVAPAEIQERVDIAANAVNNTDDFYISALRDYGLGSGDLVAAMLDRNRALPLLQKTVRMAQIGAEAGRQGLDLAEERASYFADLGVSQDEAQQAYQAIGSAVDTAERLSDIYDVDFGQEELEDELLAGSGLASQRRARLTQREVGAFAGTSGAGRRSLTRETSGQY